MSNETSKFITKSTALRGVLLLAATLAVTLVVTACDSGGGSGPVDTNPCATDASLCAPLATLLDTGEAMFQNCTGCHGNEGKGSAGSTPPLANSDFFMNNKEKTIAILLGISPEQGSFADSIFVNGLWYQNTMPGWSFFTDLEIAGVLTYLRVVKNDSIIGTCSTTNFDPEGFPICSKIGRTTAERNADTVAVWQVKHMRDSLGIDQP